MNKTQTKQALLVKQPKCPVCGCKMVVSNWNRRNPYSNEAVLKNDHLLCLGCHRRQCKLAEIERLPFFIRWKKKIDSATGIITCYHRIRKRINKFIYVNIRGGQLTGRA